MHHAYANDRTAIARAFEGLHHPTLPPHLKEHVYKMMISGFLMGKIKCPNDHQCRTCACPEESTVHTFLECKLAAATWKRVLNAWKRTTGEVVPLNHRTVLAGDRPMTHAGHTCFDYLEEPWRLVHAITAKSLWKNRNVVRAGKASKTAQQIHDVVRRQLIEAADARLAYCRALDTAGHPAAQPGNAHALDTFHERWIASGLTRYTREGAHMLVRAHTHGF